MPGRLASVAYASLRRLVGLSYASLGLLGSLGCALLCCLIGLRLRLAVLPHRPKATP
eukprot:CAMPEP_0172525926 /NCGR_PEP_ID=MMETSP1067-20121228/940_1 /TAXON_ID=265564 ORGANISM="Thalassiosira punctigera, Strain Tpunct2005C2" /NCGR_SAMPLE_ID=MMETSP1067 /ASSEMBLY_ACC=CAM_ASM_000444 /LENGTH=56 /DNA_ID=CAMNT_0013309317 /DNA_START=51 /DNA_END=218 /DNA_ORIENTATION=-